MHSLHTVGHSNHTFKYFLNLLLINNIHCIVDVRSTPYSQFVPQFDTDKIKQELHANGIHYIYLGKELGARREDKRLYTNGYLDFAKIRTCDKCFQSGIKRVIEGVNKGFSISIMCTEKDPIDCHRSILISKAFIDIGYNISHIKENGKIETHKDLEQRLIYLFFPDIDQTSIFDVLNGPKSREELLEKAYVLKNKEIGYKLSREA
jgi:uncharacterized protein (DUF488 family)